MLRLLGTAGALVALAALWRYRPDWPDLPDSLAAPVTIALLQQLAFIAAWMLAALVALLLLARNLARAQARGFPDLSGVGLSARGSARSRRARPFAVRPLALRRAEREFRVYSRTLAPGERSACLQLTPQFEWQNTPSSPPPPRSTRGSTPAGGGSTT